MTIIGKLIIGGFVLLFIILVFDRIMGEYFFEYRDELFYKKSKNSLFEVEKIQKYTHKKGLDKWAMGIIEKEYERYCEDPYDTVNQRRMSRVYKSALKPLEDLFEESEKEIYKSGTCEELQDLVIKCYGNII